MPHPDYWPRLREMCDRHGIVLIADEVINGFGRTGKWFAMEHFGVTPDLMTVAKQISSGYAPIAAVLATDKIADGFRGDPTKAFVGGRRSARTRWPAPWRSRTSRSSSASGSSRTPRRSAPTSPEQLRPAERHPTVSDVRGIGLMQVIDLMRDPETGRRVHAGRRPPATACRGCSRTRHPRRAGASIQVAPPLTINREEVDEIVDGLDQTVGDLERELGIASNGGANGTGETATWTVKAGLAQMLKGGVIMDVTDAEQAEIAQEAGAVAVMALERVPADIRKEGGVARMSHVKKVREIQESVSIPVMAKARIGHFVEAQVLEALGIDYIDESEVLTPADDIHHIDKHAFQAPFVCGARNLGEALRRISEGAAMIRTKGEAGTGDIVEAVRHMRSIWAEIRRVQSLREDELFVTAKELQVPVELVREVRRLGKLPVVNFSAGGVATPADAALMMQLGAEGVFVGSGIFKSGMNEPTEADRRRVQAKMASAIVKAVTHFNDPQVLAEVSAEIPDEAMRDAWRLHGTDVAGPAPGRTGELATPDAGRWC
jgi:pyridoxal 5'-phosphate synthase pdxS subunit